MDTQNKKQENERPNIVNHMTNCNVIQGDQYGGVFPLPGSQVTINQQFGKGQKPKQEVAEGKVESADEREKRKTEIMRTITEAFDFSDEQLGRDNKRKPITNARLAVLFRKCFGMSSYPTAANKVIIEQLWTLLIDERNQCPKDAKLGYIPQTVLNIIGYFKQRDLVSGTRMVLAQSVYKDADSNMARNIERAVSSNVFPEGTMDLLDYYIDKLMEGEF